MTQDNKSWEENWSEEFDEKFVDKPESYTTHEEPYKIGERNYTGEHYIMPAYTLKLNIGQAEIKRFIHSTLNKEKVLLVEEIIKDLDNIWRKQLPIADAEDAVEKTRSAMIEQANYLQSLLS